MINNIVLITIDSEKSPVEYLFASMDDWDHRFTKDRDQITLEDGSYLDNGRCYEVLETESNGNLELRMLPPPQPSYARIRFE